MARKISKPRQAMHTFFGKVSESVLYRLRALSFYYEKPMAELVREAIDKYLEGKPHYTVTVVPEGGKP